MRACEMKLIVAADLRISLTAQKVWISPWITNENKHYLLEVLNASNL
jgi:hypothetical protein